MSSALAALTEITAQIPADRLSAAVQAYAPGSRPEQLPLQQIARCLGVRGVAQCWNVPAVYLLRRLGPERCAVEDIIAPNPYAANGREAIAAAYQPVPGCACKGARGMGDVNDDGIEIDDIFGPDPTPSAPAPQMADGWPAAPPFRAGNWNFEKCEYTLAQGDTVSGLSRLYLGRPNRFLEIWQLQPFRFTYKMDASSKNPGRAIQEGDVFIMPAEACERAKLMVKEGKPSAPPTGGAPGTQPGASKDGLHESAPSTKKDLIKYGAIAAGVLVVGGVTYYAVT